MQKDELGLAWLLESSCLQNTRRSQWEFVLSEIILEARRWVTPYIAHPCVPSAFHSIPCSTRQDGCCDDGRAMVERSLRGAEECGGGRESESSPAAVTGTVGVPLKCRLSATMLVKSLGTYGNKQYAK